MPPLGRSDALCCAANHAVVSGRRAAIVPPQLLLRVKCPTPLFPSARQSAMHERYPGLKLCYSRHTAQLDRRCPRITPPTRNLTRADLERSSATILASEPPPEVIIGLAKRPSSGCVQPVRYPRHHGRSCTVGGSVFFEFCSYRSTRIVESLVVLHCTTTTLLLL